MKKKIKKNKVSFGIARTSVRGSVWQVRYLSVDGMPPLRHRTDLYVPYNS